jgi:putative ABC transport system permease protein
MVGENQTSLNQISDMFKNYLKTAWRNLKKNKITSFINLFGLSVGMTAAVFIFLWVQNEISYNDYHPGKENVYRVTNSIQISSNEAWVWENSPMLLAETAQREIPSLQKTARAVINAWGGPVFNINNKLFSEKTSAYIDDSWFDMFHYDFAYGNAASFAKNPYGIILTESKAKKYFGNTNAVGKLIKADTINYTVEAVIKDNPSNSSFRFDILIQMRGYLLNPQKFKNDKSWNNFGYITFLQLRPGTNQATVAKQVNSIIDNNRSNHNDKVSLQPLTAMYFEDDLQSSDMPHGNKKVVYIFTLLGVLLLIIASINYVNLTTAKASLRAKEVSIKKIVGANRSSLIVQFIAESVCISLIALLITLAVIQLCLPLFNAITEEHFKLPLTSVVMWKILGGTLLFTALLNGIYPATLLSSFKPLNVFRGKSFLRIQDGSIRKGLVVFQFTLSVILIVGAIVIYSQLKFIQTENPGYNIAQVMSLQIPWQTYSRMDDTAAKFFFDNIKHDLQLQSSIADGCVGGDEIVNVGSMSSGNADWDGRDTSFNPSIARLETDAHFQKMFQLQMVQGHWFRPGNGDEHNYILNETAAKEFNMYKPLIGQRFTWGGDTGKVIGVVKDFHYKSLHEKIGPMVLLYGGGTGSYVFTKAYPGNIPAAINAARSVWKKYVPGKPFAYNFLDDSFNTLYKTDIKTSRLILIFSLIAIIISALGLFGLATFSAEQRVKEIGIRKVLGASVQQITMLISKEFIMLVLMAIIIAVPVSWYAMNKWLMSFAYRINLSYTIFVAAGFIAVLIAVMSVSAQAIKAAVRNPSESLRME